MVEIRRVLCPVDFSEFSRHALDHALALAKWYGGAKVTVFHVFSSPVPPVPAPAMPGDLPLLPRVRPEEVVDDVRRFCGPGVIAPDGPAEIVVKEGRPAKEIALEAERLPADLLVMGTHGRDGLERLVLGSVTEKVLRITDVPVLTVPPAVERAGPVRYNTILCPIEFDDPSIRALEYALLVAKETDARLILLHVIEGVIDPSFSETHHFSVPEYFRYLQDDALTRLKAAVPDEARVWCKPEERLASGKPYREILRTAADENAQLIVMGVHGRGALHRRMLGSTTNHVIREAGCPVLTLRG